MKNNQCKSHFKDTKSQVEEIAMGDATRESEDDGTIPNAHSKIEAAYTDLRNEYNKANDDK